MLTVVLKMEPISRNHCAMHFKVSWKNNQVGWYHCERQSQFCWRWTLGAFCSEGVQWMKTSCLLFDAFFKKCFHAETNETVVLTTSVWQEDNPTCQPWPKPCQDQEAPEPMPSECSPTSWHADLPLTFKRSPKENVCGDMLGMHIIPPIHASFWIAACVCAGSPC